MTYKDMYKNSPKKEPEKQKPTEADAWLISASKNRFKVASIMDLKNKTKQVGKRLSYSTGYSLLFQFKDKSYVEFSCDYDKPRESKSLLEATYELNPNPKKENVINPFVHHE